MSASAKLFLRKDYTTSKGENPVYLRLIINCSQKNY